MFSRNWFCNHKKIWWKFSVQTYSWGNNFATVKNFFMKIFGPYLFPRKWFYNHNNFLSLPPFLSTYLHPSLSLSLYPSPYRSTSLPIVLSQLSLYFSLSLSPLRSLLLAISPSLSRPREIFLQWLTIFHYRRDFLVIHEMFWRNSVFEEIILQP